MLAHKTLLLSDCSIKLAEETGRFSGYASTFGGVDSYGDTILPGAFKQTLKKNGMPKMYIQHDAYSLPVGKWLSANEDDKGLLVEGEFTPGMMRAAEAHAALKHGTVDGLSIGYRLAAEDYKIDEITGQRIIKRVTQLAEISIVTYPADGAARIDLSSVKSAVEELETIRDFERFLRDAGGLSKGLTQALISRAKIVFGREEPGNEDTKANPMEELAKRLHAFRA